MVTTQYITQNHNPEDYNLKGGKKKEKEKRVPYIMQPKTSED